MRLPQLLLLHCVLAAAQAPPMVAMPPSTLVPPGATTLALSVTSSEPTSCRWDTVDVPFASMAHAFVDDGTAHATTLVGLSGNLTLSVFFVQCEAFAASGAPLVLSYRALPDSGNAPFPRLGNLWGSGNFRGHPSGLAYAAARSSLWLGSDWDADEIASLRALNPYTIAMNSINACETDDANLPDDFYLLNISQPASTRGRLQSWPGAWRLDLTNPRVQAYQAQLMYCLVAAGGSGYGPSPNCANISSGAPQPLVYDGLFVDNVFMDDGASVNAFDIFGNPFYPVNQSTMAPFGDFNVAWRSGMVAEIALFRAMMPFALMDGHAMDITDADISAQFNAISIGFVVPQMVEGLQSFSAGLSNYDAWMTLPSRSPKITMVESAVRLQLGYGYGFNGDLATLISNACENSNSVPGAPVPGNGDACCPAKPQPPGYILPQTFMLARSEYQYFRFGFGFTLMRDGFFAHELGDSWHGQDWVYDETNFFLGAPLGNATDADVLNPDPTPIPPPVPLTTSWSLYVRSPNSSNASWSFDAAVRPSPSAPASVRVDVQGTAPSSDGIDLSQLVTLQDGGYLLSFWGKASREGTPVQMNARKNGGDWHDEGLSANLVFSSQWEQFNVTFIAATDGAPSRLSWFFGSAASDTSLWVNSPSLDGVAIPRPVLTRAFECGTVVLNGDTAANTVAVGSGLNRLQGQQAPLWQYFVDDSSSAFQSLSGAWATADFDNGYDGANAPESEQVRPENGYYHHWMKGAKTAPAGASASFNLLVPVEGVYNVSMWWPAAVPARSAWATAMLVTIGPDFTTTVDLTTQGGDVFFAVASNLLLQTNATLVVECPANGGTCVADAVLVESAARWNDGSATTTVLLQPMDAIVLNRTAGAPAHCNAVNTMGTRAA